MTSEDLGDVPKPRVRRRQTREDQGYAWNIDEPRSYSHPSRAVEQPGGDVRFPPVENGIDYLLSVMESLAKDDGSEATARELKYGVLHLQAAAEVLLKARLQREHWTLVLQKLDQRATRARFVAGDFVSCGSDEAVVRLRDIVGLDISKDDQDALKALATARNALQHYGLASTAADVELTAMNALDFLIRFLDQHLLPALPETEQQAVRNDVETIRMGLAKIKAFVTRRMDRVRQELSDFRDRTLECLRCRQMALLVDGGSATCYFCSRTGGSGNATLDYVFHVQGLWWGMDEHDPVGPCPHCGHDALVFGAKTVATGEESVDFCFDCSTTTTRRAAAADAPTSENAASNGAPGPTTGR
ncbi:hypothetical protein AB0C76_15500 [Kitasatospora sp. NPDC048722]|uniref:hypothetical protein n=1 Tax=Kitasatospora sp. NPDC048722 TaxID=3155639 RepID=UPI0033CB8D5A